MKNIFFISILALAILALGYTIFKSVDHEFYHSKYQNKIWVDSDCEYQIPNGYKLVYNELTKEYAVKVLSYNDYYLYRSYTYGITEMFSSIAHPCVFEDSCEAKGFLKEYIIPNN